MYPMEIGKKIRLLRKKNGDTLDVLSTKIEFDLSSLSKVERGIRKADIGLLRRICAVYHISPTYFFGEGFTESEGDLLLEEDLDPSSLKEKYKFEIDGVEASEDEIIEAIKMIRYFRTNSN